METQSPVVPKGVSGALSAYGNHSGFGRAGIQKQDEAAVTTIFNGSAGMTISAFVICIANRRIRIFEVIASIDDSVGRQIQHGSVLEQDIL